jgi:hypothetical protein
MVAAFPVTTWSFQRVFQMYVTETYRLKEQSGIGIKDISL